MQDNEGKAALGYGPFLYCLEGVDHKGVDLRDVVLSPEAELTATYHPTLLGDVTVLEGAGVLAPPSLAWSEALYGEENGTPAAPPSPVSVKAIPYFAWANREPGQMLLWIRHQ